MERQPKDSERSRWFGFVQLILLLGVIALALYFARAPGRVVLDDAASAAREAGTPAVNVFHPVSTEQALTVKLTGTVEVHDKVAVRSEVRGRVLWVSPKFRNGGSLAANETFVKVDPAGFELRVKAAKMAVKAAEAQLQIEKARAKGKAFIAKAEAELGRAKATLELAELELTRTEISLPYATRVAKADTSVGELVGPADTVVGPASTLGVVYRPEALQVDAPVELKDLEYLDPAIGRAAHIQTRSGNYDAEIVRVSSLVTPQTRMASLFFKFSEPLGSLPLPNTFVEVVITGPAHDNVYVLPESVIQERESVWVVSDGVLKAMKPRAIGRTDTGLVVEAFDARDGIVVGTLPGAREGLAVTVREAASSG